MRDMDDPMTSSPINLDQASNGALWSAADEPFRPSRLFGLEG